MVEATNRGNSGTESEEDEDSGEEEAEEKDREENLRKTSEEKCAAEANEEAQVTDKLSQLNVEEKEKTPVDH